MAQSEMTEEENRNLRLKATYASVFVAGSLITTKLGAYFMTDSVSILSSLMDSTMDIFASLITAFGVARAVRPPDQDHRYGHGKAEPLASLAQATFILGSCALLSAEAFGRFFKPRDVQNETTGYLVMVLSMVMTFALISYQRYVVRRTSSLAIGADSLHYTGDLLSNGAVIASLAVQDYFRAAWVDPAFALAIAAGMGISAVKIARKSLEVLMDKELPDVDREKIMALAKAQNKVLGVHDLRTRTDGEKLFVEIHIELDKNMSVEKAHDVVEKVMEQIEKEYPKADVLVHQDPYGIEEKRLDEQIAAGCI